MNITLSEAIKLFLGEYIDTTSSTYRQTLSPMADFVGPSKPLSSITSIHLLEWSNHLRSHRKPDGKTYSDATLHKHIRTVKLFFNWCVKIDALEKSPADAVKQQKVTRKVDKEEAMTDEEYERVLEYFRHRSRYMVLMQRNLALFLFIGDTGCRSGGAGGARWEDIDFERQTAVLLEKGRRRNLYYFGDECAQELIKWRNHPRNTGEVYVFSTDEEPLSAASIKSLLYRACKKVGIRNRAGHSIRHRKGFKMAEAGIPMTTAQLVFNHESIKSTEVYYPRSTKLAEEASRKLAHKTVEEEKILRLNKRTN